MAYNFLAYDWQWTGRGGQFAWK